MSRPAQGSVMIGRGLPRRPVTIFLGSHSFPCHWSALRLPFGLEAVLYQSHWPSHGSASGLLPGSVGVWLKVAVARIVSTGWGTC